MKIKNKFLDVTLDDLALGDAKPFDVSGTDVAGKKVFTSMPKTTGTTENMNDAATWAYLQTRKENVKGDAELLVLPILQKDIDAKGITFEYPVASGLHGSVMVQILHGPELARDMDFTLMANGAGISWDGYALDGRLKVGDVLVVAYKRGPMWETIWWGQRLGTEAEIHSLGSLGSGVVLAGTYPTGQVYKSTDSGDTWNLVQRLGTESRVYSLVSLGSGVVLAGTGTTGQIYKSTDSGDTWDLVQRLGTETRVRSLISLGSEVVLAGTGQNGQVYKREKRQV